MRSFTQPPATGGVITTDRPQVDIDSPAAEIAEGLQMNTIFSCKVTASWRRAFGVRRNDRPSSPAPATVMLRDRRLLRPPDRSSARADSPVLIVSLRQLFDRDAGFWISQTLLKNFSLHFDYS